MLKSIPHWSVFEDEMADVGSVLMCVTKGLVSLLQRTPVEVTPPQQDSGSWNIFTGSGSAWWTLRDQIESTCIPQPEEKQSQTREPIAGEETEEKKKKLEGSR